MEQQILDRNDVEARKLPRAFVADAPKSCHGRGERRGLIIRRRHGRTIRTPGKGINAKGGVDSG
jgi:hypothetical protein